MPADAHFSRLVSTDDGAHVGTHLYVIIRCSHDERYAPGNATDSEDDGDDNGCWFACVLAC